MPRTRTSARQDRDANKSSPCMRKPTSMRPSPELLRSSSSPEPANTPNVRPSKRTTFIYVKMPKPKPRIPPPTEVIEISSDEGDAPLTQESLIADLRKQVRNLKKENDGRLMHCQQLVRELAQCKGELGEIKAKTSATTVPEGKLALDISQLDDSLNCEICTHRMWSPQLLPECGHTFCLSCLQDWFNNCLARFMQAHPQWSPHYVNGQFARIQGLLRPQYLNSPYIGQMLAELQQPLPEYVCPACRKPVHTPPTEVYALKSLVRSVASASGEAVPPDAPTMINQYGRLVVRKPWEAFFPSRGR